MEKTPHPALVGMLCAVQAVLRALIETHPDPKALHDALCVEAESTVALLLARSVSEVCIDACRDFLAGVETS